MGSMMKKAAVREIKGSFGRYFAILAIIALGVGFFSGVRITTPAMVHTVDSFMREHELYDFRILSSAGWSAEDAETFSNENDVRCSEAAYSLDAIYNYKNGKENVLRTHSITTDLNTLDIVEGRLPQAPDECVVDADMNKVPDIGTEVTLSAENDDKTAESLRYRTFKVVGKAYSPYYVNFERGTTSIGNGSVTGFLYIRPEAFAMDRYTEIYVKLSHDYEIYSDDYKDYIHERRDRWEALAAETAADSSSTYMEKLGIPASEAPSVYVLDRNTNIGYACFESDSEIVAQVARVFPIFFILVAALVCMTTMSRMVEEQRTQIGVFKALGYPDSSIMLRYMFYSGSAALIGCVIGYTVGIFLFPGVIWMTYKLMYVPLPMRFIFDPALAAGALAVSLTGSMGVTWLTCRYELSETSASLMRPKAPKAGKRVLLERMPFIWNRLKFLYKVSIRNIFRYKKRLFMMITGISGCTALLLTGFGLKDSIAGFAEMQYEEILVADASIVFNTNEDGTVPDNVAEELESSTSEYLYFRESSWDLLCGDKVKSIDLVVPEDFSRIDSFFRFHKKDGTAVSTPSAGEAIVSNSIQERYGADIGDEIFLRDDSMRELRVKVVGVFENHVYNYVFISPETVREQLGTDAVFNAAYINFEGSGDIHESASPFMKNKQITTTVIYEDLKVRMANMMSSLNYIVLLVIASAAGLAFIVIYNLTNINITERIREIATIKVLGFFPGETSAYVLRENIALTAAGTAIGLGLGILLHRFIMAQIVVDLVSFSVKIRPVSYIYSVILTFVFNFAVDLFMSRKLEKINMAESLKSVD